MSCDFFIGCYCRNSEFNAVNLQARKRAVDKIHDILKRYWGYDEFRSLQEEIILSVIDGRDTLALMPTGGGKSITYQVAALTQEGICVVITPLIALMKDQVEDLKKRNISAESIYTGISREQMQSIINKCIYTNVKFLYISPERLASETFRTRLKQMKICLFAVDEAHCISQWGYDFRPSYMRIAEMRSFFPEVPVLALTATATPQVVEDIQNRLEFKQHHVLSKSFRRENIAYVVRSVDDKMGEVATILSKIKGCAIVYTRRRSATEILAKYLSEQGIPSDFYHAGLSSFQREKKQTAWKNNDVPVIVATNAFGMGIDKSDVRIVVHFDIPDSPEAYFQEAGRAGRDGQKAYAVLLYNAGSLAKLKERVSKGFPEKSFIRQVYNSLANFFELEEGEGEGHAFEFDRDRFIRVFKLDYARAIAAIEILQVGGYIECTTDVNSRSKISFLVLRNDLYSIEIGNDFAERLLEILMRKYAGIFVQYIHIHEQLIADTLGVTRSDVYNALIILARRKIISYIPGNDRPYIIYHQPRLPLSYITIGADAYEKRKESYTHKVTSMQGYIKLEGECRQLFLMRYFGQKEQEECGICDICLSRKRRRTYSAAEIDRIIIDKLTPNPMHVKQLTAEISGDTELIAARIQALLQDKIIYFESALVLQLTPKHK